jgi:hypothetical protein
MMVTVFYVIWRDYDIKRGLLAGKGWKHKNDMDDGEKARGARLPNSEAQSIIPFYGAAKMKSPIGSAVFRVLLIIGTVATLYLGYVNAFDPVNRFIPLLGVITTSVTAILGLPEAWDRFGPTKSTHKRPAKPVNEATYLNGRLEIFAKEDKWFMPLAGDTVVESGLDAFKDAFSQQTVGVRKKEYAKVSSAARDYRQFVIVGEPGAGKTTVLKHLALAVIRSRLNPDIETESLMATLYDGLRVPLPLWIDLGNSANPPDAEALLHYWWNQVYALKGSVESGLNNLDVWLFLDGLNEMPEQGVGWRKRARSLRAWLKKYPDVRALFDFITNRCTSI